MNENHLARRALACTALALLTAILLAACGSSTSSSSSPSASAASGASTRRTALVTCLRKHGVTLPRGVPGGGPPSGAPGAGGGSGGGGFGGGGARRFSGAGRGKFQAAFKACGTNFARGGPRFAFSHQAISKYLTCVRQHGYQLPAPNFSGHGPVFPAGIRSNAKFQKASAACQSLLRPSGAPGSPGAPPGA
jgi:hypothetical protein